MPGGPYGSLGIKFQNGIGCTELVTKYAKDAEVKAIDPSTETMMLGRK